MADSGASHSGARSICREIPDFCDKIAGADFAGKNLSQKSGAKVKLVRLTFATRRGPDSAPLRTWCRFQDIRDKTRQFQRKQKRRPTGRPFCCRFQKTAALNVRSRLHYSSGGGGSIRQRRAAAGQQRAQGGLSAPGRSMRHRWPSRRGSESARIDLRCPTSH